MSDEEQNVKNEDTQEKESVDKASAETKKTEDEHMIPKSRFDEVNTKYQDAEKRIKALEKSIEDGQKKRLKEQEDYKALYETTEGELAELKPKAERAETLEAVLQETLEAEMKSIPQDKLSLIPDELSTDAKLRYISKNRALLSKASPLDQGAGNRGGGESTVADLTPDELQVARDWGMKPEEYAKYKDNNNS
jgi:ribonucleoside-triphosphate reductase